VNRYLVGYCHRCRTYSRQGFTGFIFERNHVTNGEDLWITRYR
jgi:hypothetical protein